MVQRTHLDIAELMALPRGRGVLLSSGNKAAMLRLVPWMDGPHADAVWASLSRWEPTDRRENREAGEHEFRAGSGEQVDLDKSDNATAPTAAQPATVPRRARAAQWTPGVNTEPNPLDTSGGDDTIAAAADDTLAEPPMVLSAAALTEAASEAAARALAKVFDTEARTALDEALAQAATGARPAHWDRGGSPR